MSQKSSVTTKSEGGMDLKQPVTITMDIPRGLNQEEVDAMEERMMLKLQEKMEKKLEDKSNDKIKELESARQKDAEKIKELEAQLAKLSTQSQAGEGSGLKWKEEDSPKKMSEIVAYTPEEKKTLELTGGEDYSDSIPAVHETGGTMVNGQNMRWCGLEGRYTGWWKGGNASGRGTWRSRNGKWRLDAVWKEGALHGAGRSMFLDYGLYQGTWKNNAAAEDNSVKQCFKSKEQKNSRWLKQGEYS